MNYEQTRGIEGKGAQLEMDPRGHMIPCACVAMGLVKPNKTDNCKH
jgi:hypothetical protein